MPRKTTKPKPLQQVQHPGKPLAIPTSHHAHPWPVVAACAAIFVLGVLPYARTPWFNYVNFDDPAYIINNPHVLTGLSPGNILWALTTDRVCNWHPLTWISYQADFSLFGGGPGVHHLINVLFHALNACLLFLVLRSMTRETWASAFVAALFAVHPMHVESVAWISERKDVLSAFFGLLTLGAYVRYARRPGTLRMAVTCVLFALGLMAKPMLVTLPATLLLLDYWPLRRLNTLGEFHRRITEKLPLIALAIISCAITFAVQDSGGGVVSVDAIPVWARLANVPVAYVQYLFLTVWPAQLGAYYPHLRDAIPLWQPVVTTVLILAVSAALVSSSRTHPYALAGWLWFLGMLVPVIGIVQVGDQALADRYSYLPHIGLFFAVIWILLPAMRRHPRIAATVSATVLIVLAARSSFQAETWRDSFALFEHSLIVAPDNYRAHVGLGVAYCDELNQYDKALEHCARAVALDPEEPSVHYNMGNALIGLGRLDEAVDSYHKALTLNAALPDTQYNLGIALARLKRYSEAITAFQETMKFDPNRAGAYNNLGSTLALMGQIEEAIPQYLRAVELAPQDIDARCNLAFALSRTGRLQEARDALTRALALDPQNSRARQALENLAAR